MNKRIITTSIIIILTAIAPARAQSYHHWQDGMPPTNLTTQQVLNHLSHQIGRTLQQLQNNTLLSPAQQTRMQTRIDALTQLQSAGTITPTQQTHLTHMQTFLPVGSAPMTPAQSVQVHQHLADLLGKTAAIASPLNLAATQLAAPSIQQTFQAINAGQTTLPAGLNLAQQQVTLGLGTQPALQALQTATQLIPVTVTISPVTVNSADPTILNVGGTVLGRDGITPLPTETLLLPASLLPLEQ